MMLIGSAVLELPPEIAQTPAMTSIFCVLMYMQIKREGIVKMPELSGPPVG